jgi:hypothetical protein
LFGNPILEIVECLEQVLVLFGFKVTWTSFNFVWISILASDHVYGHVKTTSSMSIIDTMVTYIYMLVSKSIRYVDTIAYPSHIFQLYTTYHIQIA